MPHIPSSVRIEARQASLDESQARIDGYLEASREGYVTSMLRIAEAAGVPEESREALRLELDVDAETVVSGIFNAMKVHVMKDERAKKAGDSAVHHAEDDLRSQAIARSVDRLLGPRRG